MTTKNSSTENQQLKKSFLTLGDGDFSYSLDLALFLKENQGDGRNGTKLDDPLPTRSQQEIQLFATGIDTYDELRLKYRDVDSILQKLRNVSPQFKGDGSIHHLNKKAKIRNKSTNNDIVHKISVGIKHSINAIINTIEAVSNDVDLVQFYSLGHDHVIFNHPHLGTEDARLHQRFLSHFFYSAYKYWLKSPGGILHLTLAKGQCERWHAVQSAKKQGFTLLHRCPFEPPPQPSSTFYQHRRHQNGKSFAARTTYKSETFTFGRQTDIGRYIATCLPWQNSMTFESNSIGPTTPAPKTNYEALSYPCPHCPKAFREKRSLKNHVLSTHKVFKEKDEPHDDIQSSSNSRTPLICDICNPPTSLLTQCSTIKEPSSPSSSSTLKPQPRLFTSAQALADHKRAKHYGLHTNIKPDWFEEDHHPQQEQYSIVNHETVHQDNERGNNDSKLTGSCKICDKKFMTQEEEIKHDMEFIPRSFRVLSKPSVVEESLPVNECSVCKKRFREKRALYQHMNFCALQHAI